MASERSGSYYITGNGVKWLPIRHRKENGEDKNEK
jgi:hypothetical protein